MDVISGIDEGVLQEISWESLPLCRVFIKERLALSTFFSYHCSPHASGPLWHLSSGLGLSLPVGEFFTVGSNLILGCNCSRWKEGAIGTLSYRSKEDCDSLLREVIILHSALGEFFCGFQAQNLEGVVQNLHLSFSSIALDS